MPESFLDPKQTGRAPDPSSWDRTAPMAKEETSVVSVKGSAGSAGHSTGACVKAFLRLVKAVS